MDLSLNEVTLAELVKMCPQFKTDERVDDYALARMDANDNFGIFRHPIRFDGVMLIYCVEGALSVDLNLNTFPVRKHSAFFYEPGNILKLHAPESGPSPDLQFYLVVASRDFVQEMSHDLSRLYASSVFVREDPLLVFPESIVDTVMLYMKLSEKLLSSQVHGSKEAIHSLANSAHSFFRSLWEKKMEQRRLTLNVRTARSQAMVDQFIRLVTEYHTKEHYLAFYAAELDITPKYLSKLVRDITGRSAPDWIDSFLVLEAKNLLKYSDLAIKEIVFRLHFPDQSSFYKFFRLHTGMIPSEYRKM